jgi:radial spoke head protein 4A
LGTEADYYVVGGKSAAADEGADGNEMEGTDGANRMCYFVCNKIGDEWVKLPDVTSAQVVASRKLKKFFSGNLDKKITGYPPFPGTEKNLLRAVIGDIAASCSASPAGVFVAEDGEMALNEDGAPDRAVDEMAELGNWEHILAGLNAYGRCTKLPEKENEDGEPIVDENEPDVQEVLRPVSGDEEGTWTTRICPSQGGAQALAVLKSLLFPGAYTVAFNQKFVNIYVGYGHRVSSKTYSPPAPGAVLGEQDIAAFVEEDDVLEDPNPPEDEANDE